MAHRGHRRQMRRMIGARIKGTLLLVGVLAAVASCSDGSPTQPIVDPVDDTSIEAQIRALFPSGPSLQGAALTQIASIRQQLVLNAAAEARSRTLTLVDFTMTSFVDGKLVGGKSVATGNAASRLVNALYQLVGMTAPNLPDSALSNDGVVKVVGPEGAVVVTPSGAAGVQIPAGALDERVLVTVTRLPTPPTPGTGPLPTSLKQYPPYYDFSTFPNVAQFGSAARVGLCQVTDPASPFYPPEPHDRLRLAHTVAGNIEILDRVAVDDFLRCASVSAMRSASETRSFGWRGAVASLNGGISQRSSVELYAHGGLGGKVKSFSPFAAVGPAVTQLAVSGGTPIVVGQTSQLTATASLSDGTTENVTNFANWQSSDQTIVAVTSAGVATAVSVGTTSVTATYQGKSGVIAVTSSAPDGFSYQIEAGVSAADEALIRETLDLGQTFFEQSFGKRVQGNIPITISTAQDLGSAGPAGIIFNTGNSYWLSTSIINKKKIAIAALFNVFEGHNGFYSNPLWFIAGGSEYVGYQGIAWLGLLDYQVAKGCQIYAVLHSPDPIPPLRDGGISSSGGVWLGVLAIDYMTGGSIANFASIVNQPATAWDAKMTAVLGISADQFYDAFETQRQTFVSPPTYNCPP